MHCRQLGTKKVETTSLHAIVHDLLLWKPLRSPDTFSRFHLFKGKKLRHRQKLPFPASFLVNPWLLHVTPGRIAEHALNLHTRRARMRTLSCILASKELLENSSVLSPLVLESRPSWSLNPDPVGVLRCGHGILQLTRGTKHLPRWTGLRGACKV